MENLPTELTDINHNKRNMDLVLRELKWYATEAYIINFSLLPSNLYLLDRLGPHYGCNGGYDLSIIFRELPPIPSIIKLYGDDVIEAYDD